MAEKNNPLSFSSLLSFLNENFSLVLIILAVFITGFAFGSMWKENKILGAKDVQPTAAAPQKNQPADSANSGTQQAALQNMPEITNSDHIKGAQDPVVTLVEYSDYDCPFCTRVHPTLQRIVDEYPNQVAWVYRHYPLDAMHPNARKAAELSECIAEYAGNNKFWEFTDEIYARKENDTNITALDNLYELAAEIGVNRSQIQNCVENEEMADVVDAHFKGGNAAGVRGTPAIMVVPQKGDYELLAGAQPYEQFMKIIEPLLE